MHKWETFKQAAAYKNTEERWTQNVCVGRKLIWKHETKIRFEILKTN